MAKTKKASTQTLDMSNVKEGGGKIRPIRQQAGDYKAKVVSAEDTTKKGDKSRKMWLFVIKAGAGLYPLYCGFNEDELWKIRNLFVAAGVPVPKKRINANPNLVVNKEIAVTLEDDEYNGKAKSTIASTFPLSEMDATDADDEEGVDDEDTAPKAKKSKKGKKGKKKKADLEELDIDNL